jgi:hypothetical protein
MTPYVRAKQHGVAGTSRHGLPKPAEAYMPQGFSWKNKAQHGASNRMS